MQPEVDAALRLPPDQRGPAILALPEDQWFDRKSGAIKARDLADALVAFANGEGGIVVIGCADGRVEGIDRWGSKENEWRQAAADHTVPVVPVHVERVACKTSAGQPDHLLVVEVAPSDRLHANRRDDVLLRIGDESRRLSFAQRRELEFDKGQRAFEVTPSSTSTVDDLDDDLLAEHAAAVGHPDVDRLLAARGLVDRDGRLTVGGLLLMGRNPQAELPGAHVRVIRYRGSERGTGRRQQIIADQRIDGPLPTQIRTAKDMIQELLPRRRALSSAGTFAEVGAIPQDAWLEGLVNAVAHRSYSLMGDHIRVEIFDDRVEIESPGRFPGIVNLNDPEAITRFARNPRIARVLSDLDLVQELGEGIRRMFEEMRLAGLSQPTFHQTAGSVRLTLATEPVDRALEDRLSDAGRDLVRAIREADRASTGDLVEVVGRSRPNVIRDLKLLEAAGVIEWVGTSPKDPRAYWRLRS